MRSELHSIGVWALSLVAILATQEFADAAGMAAGQIALAPGSAGSVVVSGEITGESTFGYTILVELVPRATSVGTVLFSPAPPTDIVQVGDPWVGVGTFTGFDTDVSGSILLNGSVDDDGAFLPVPVMFSGMLAEFPVIASVDADGVWDLLLSTSAGESSWEGVATLLTAGEITITPKGCGTEADCDDGNVCTDDACNAGACEYTNNTLPCTDGLFCTLTDACSGGVCVGSGTPCGVGEDCDEACDSCVSSTCDPPTVIDEGARYFAVTPAAGTELGAILVTILDPADAVCLLKYVGANAVLQDAAVFQTPAEWQTVHVRGLEVVPSFQYFVQWDCQSGSVSSCVGVSTWVFSDGNNTGNVDIDDILLLLAGFAGDFTFATFENVDQLPCTPAPGLETIDLDDILAGLAAFADVDYSTVCPMPCD